MNRVDFSNTKADAAHLLRGTCKSGTSNVVAVPLCRPSAPKALDQVCSYRGVIDLSQMPCLIAQWVRQLRCRWPARRHGHYTPILRSARIIRAAHHFVLSCFKIAFALLLVLPAIGPASADTREIFRIRVENSAKGRVQVSIDQGKSYTTTGHVRRPAVSVQRGFPASAYSPVNTIAATAVHGIRIRVAPGGDEQVEPLNISLVPAEFDTIPRGYGGHVPYGSGIYTDIPTGWGIFRNFAPFVGSPVKLERDAKTVDPPRGWKPKEGDVIIILTYLPQPYLRELIFENHTGGAVTAKYDDASEKRIATVTRPVKGVGRFDATSYTGVGRMNTNHGGVITISTAPITQSKLLEGYGPERRGGFQIQPSEHATTQPIAPQAMTVAPIDGTPLEGHAPLFSGYIGLAYRSTTDVSIRGGAWEPMPQVVGKVDDGLSRLGVTAFRIIFPRYDKAFLEKSLRTARP